MIVKHFHMNNQWFYHFNTKSGPLFVWVPLKHINNINKLNKKKVLNIAPIN